ncbi:MAG TPA: hypothetical protein VFL86_09980, partial [Burkholderiaceae bacterium]|nr:hypothetical protein [Burkholderiaceae bacterium]
MATSPVGSPRAEAPRGACPPVGPEAPGASRPPDHAGTPLSVRNAVPGPRAPRGKLPDGRSAVQALQRLEQEFGDLVRIIGGQNPEAGQGAAACELADLALRIAKQRAGLPPKEAIRAIPDMRFVSIMATAALRQESLVGAALSTYNAAVEPMQERLDRDKAAYLNYVDRHDNSTGKARSFAWVAAVDRAGRMAAHAQELVMLNQRLQPHYKRHIALCEATLTVHGRLHEEQRRNLEDALTITRLYQFSALSRQVHEQGRLFLWACVNPHAEVFAGLEIEELLPVVEKLTTYEVTAIASRIDGSRERGHEPLPAEERAAIDGIRVAAADCAAYMAALADEVNAGSGVLVTGASDRSIRNLAIGHLRDLEDTGWELADMARALLEPIRPQAAAATSREAPAAQARPHTGHKAKGKRPSAPRARARPAAQAQARQAMGRVKAAAGAGTASAAAPPLAPEPPPQAPSAGELRAWISQLADKLKQERDPRPAHRKELQQLCKVATPEKLVCARLDHARQLEAWAHTLLAAREKLDRRDLHLLTADERRQASSLKEQAATLAAQLQDEAQTQARDIDRFKLDRMKIYPLPEQSHWEELLDRGQAHAVQLPQALPASLRNTLFEVELRPAPLAGHDQPPPSVWLHLHTGQAEDAARLHTLPPAAFTAMHLKSDLERRRGRNWQALQLARGLPKERIHRGRVD